MNEKNERLPWHEAHWHRIEAARSAGRLPHAMLLYGPSGLGKELLAHQLAALSLCETPADKGPCGACRGCRLQGAGTHPDLHGVVPEEGKVAISIDQVRALGEDLSLLPHVGPYKVAIICPAEAMTMPAANALLKTLEEPPGAALILLVARRASALPPTIRSRCQLLGFRAPASAEASAWLARRHPDKEDWPAVLELAGGAPLLALALARAGAARHLVDLEGDLQAIIERRADPLAVATQWAGEDRELWWNWLHGRVSTLIRQKMFGGNPETRHSGADRALPNYLRNFKLTALLDYRDALLRVRPTLDGVPNPAANEKHRRQMEPIVDALLIPWMHDLEPPERWRAE